MEQSISPEQFNIKPTIEQTPFESPAVQSFFGKWCEINDGIRPEFVDRNVWEEHGGIERVLEEKPDGKKVLFIPKDLQLWEMVGVMEAVDNDTFSENPEKRTAKKEELLQLGKTFENAGIYIAQRMDSIDQGKKIAENLAVQFYDYGQSLTIGRKPDEDTNIELLKHLEIPSGKLLETDRWLAGDQLYGSRFDKLPKDTAGQVSPEQEEVLRRETLAQFFRVSEMAFDRQKKADAGETKQKDQSGLKPWESATPIHTGFIDKAEKQMQRAIEAPRREIEGSIFRRGMELLQRNMPFDKLSDNIKETLLEWGNGEKTLRKALEIDIVKERLIRLREAGDISAIVECERNNARNIQLAVSNYPYQEDANNPSQILMDETINCVAASMLGGALLSELGINYLVANLPKHEHSILFLVTSDEEVEYLDMLDPKASHKLTDKAIVGQNGDGEQLTVADIAAFSKNPNRVSLKFALSGEKSIPVEVAKPIPGHQLQVLVNMGSALFSEGFYEEAVETYQHAIDLGLDIDSDLIHFSLGEALKLSRRFDEAIEEYKKAIDIDPTNPSFYIPLGLIFEYRGEKDKAIEQFENVIKFSDPEEGKENITQAEAKIAALTT